MGDSRVSNYPTKTTEMKLKSTALPTWLERRVEQILHKVRNTVTRKLISHRGTLTAWWKLLERNGLFVMVWIAIAWTKPKSSNIESVVRCSVRKVWSRLRDTTIWDQTNTPLNLDNPNLKYYTCLEWVKHTKGPTHLKKRTGFIPYAGCQ